MSSQSRPVALISGANTGIGLAAATQLAKQHGYHVIIGSRNSAAGQKAATSLTADGFAASSVQLDVCSDESIEAAVKAIEHDFGKLDVLINNAGILIDYVPGVLDTYKDLSTRERFEQTFNTNVIGVACLTEACLPLLRKVEVPRVVFVSSTMGSLAMSTDKSTAWYPIDYKTYDSSKAALNMLAINYARILEPDGGLVNIACPGLVKTKLTRYIAYGTTTEEGAERIVELATLKKGEFTATFSSKNGTVPW